MKEERKEITPMDVAKLLGVEKEYDDLLIEKELKEAYDTIMSDEFKDLTETENKIL